MDISSAFCSPQRAGVMAESVHVQCVTSPPHELQSIAAVLLAWGSRCAANLPCLLLHICLGTLRDGGYSSLRIDVWRLLGNPCSLAIEALIVGMELMGNNGATVGMLSAREASCNIPSSWWKYSG